MRVSFAVTAVLLASLPLLAQVPPLPPVPPAPTTLQRALPTAQPTPTTVAAPAANPLVWDAPLKEIKAKPGETEALFTFWVTNTSTTAEASIIAARSSCGCTVAKLPSQPWTLKPGESGSISATMNVLGKHGKVTKTITLETTGGRQVLTVSTDVPTPAPGAALPAMSDRERNQMAALSDRQAIFRNDCATCHVEPTIGRTGEKLFVTACGICHTAEHRAAMVPDLSALKVDTNADYWRTWITHGKPGTLMAAFSKKHGGILDDAQIDSLVEYLVKAYPSKGAATPTAAPAAK